LSKARYPRLAYVDPFGITIFNRLQMDVVIPELIRLRSEENAYRIGTIIDRIIQFATRSRDEVHLYLEFEGDYVMFDKCRAR
jgi:hypothetical protein